MFVNSHILYTELWILYTESRILYPESSCTTSLQVAQDQELRYLELRHPIYHGSQSQNQIPNSESKLDYVQALKIDLTNIPVPAL